MFIDDFSNIISLYGSEEKFKCYLEPANKDFEKTLISIIPSHFNSYRSDFNDKVRGFLKTVASHLTQKGYVVFEFIEITDINDVVSYSLEPVLSLGYKSNSENVIQVLNPEIANKLNYSEVSIPKDKCYIIEFPEALGGRKMYTEFLEDFENIESKSPYMNYFQNPLMNQQGYDVTAHQRINDIEFWKKSNQFGWHHRGGHDKFISPYYSIYRNLQFRKSQIILRDFIIDELKKIVISLSEKLIQQKIEIKIDGLVSLGMIDEKLEKWKKGETLPGEISNVM
jgi:hypothetical protein